MAKVLNGPVYAGDRVAYATRCGSWMTMNIARVTEVIPPENGGGLRVLVEQSSDSYVSDRIRILGVLDRVVKL
jgi:hypothetical protein